MKFRTALFLIIVSVLMTGVVVGQTKAPKAAADKPAFVELKEYDPVRDANKDIAEAVKEAQRTHRNVLLEIGGKWCVWCGYLDKFFTENPSLLKYRQENYVMVKINFSPENKNEAVISKYGKVPGYPHFFVLDSTGKLLHSQDTSKLEQGRGYNLGAVATFLKEWAPGSVTTGTN